MKNSIIKKSVILILLLSVFGFAFEISGIFIMLENTQKESIEDYKSMFTSIIDNMYSQEEDTLEMRLYDYAVWDEMYSAVRTLDYEWSYRNATKFLYEDENYEVDLVLVIGEISGYYEFYGDEGLDKKIIGSNYFKQLMEDKSPILCYDEFDGELYRLALSPVSDNEMVFLNGYYVMGQKINSEYIDKINAEFLNLNQFLGNDNAPIDKDGSIIINHQFLNYLGDSVGEINYYFDDKKYISIFDKLFGHTASITFMIVIFINVFLIYSLRKGKKLLDGIIHEINIVGEGKYDYIIEDTGVGEIDVVLDHINLLSTKVYENIEELKNNNLETLEILINLIEEKDPYTRGHSERVMEMALVLGRSIDYPNIDELMEAALLHDIGKIGIDEKILNKPDKLTFDEFSQIKTHPERGSKVLGNSARMLYISKIIRQHHERFDGNGYPLGIRGKDIELGARIISVVDAFDAMTSYRSYRRAKSFGEAVSILIEQKDMQFDGEIVDVFLANLEKISVIVYEK